LTLCDFRQSNVLNTAMSGDELDNHAEKKKADETARGIGLELTLCDFGES